MAPVDLDLAGKAPSLSKAGSSQGLVSWGQLLALGLNLQGRAREGQCLSLWEQVAIPAEQVSGT